MMEDPDASESLPKISSMRNLLLSEEHRLKEYIDMRLGLANDPNVATIWRRNVSEIFDGMMIISDKLSNQSSEIIQDDINLLNSLVSRFESRDI